MPVLLYHHLLTEEENRLYRENGSVISTDEFEWQMKWLHDNGWQTVSSRELIDFLYEGKALPKKSVLITFDDGYASNLRYAAPVLRQYGYTAVIFVSGTLLAQQPAPWDGDELQMMDPESMRDYTDVFEFHSHSYALHATDADGQPLMLSQTAVSLAEDTQANLAFCTANTLYAYPYGAFNENTLTVLPQHGVRAAFTTKQGYASLQGDPMQIGRFIVFPGTSQSRFIHYLEEALS